MYRHIQYEEAYRQGEIVIFKVKEFPSSYQGKPKPIKNHVIREGEKEGHEHKLVGGEKTLSLFDDREMGTIEVKKATTLTHPEHGDLKLPAGKYVVGVQKEATGKNAHASVKD